MSKIAGIVFNDTANAPGICTSVYLSGCDFHCRGCHNQETWDFDYGNEMTIDDIITIEKSLHENEIERSLCILGGEPLHIKNIAYTIALMSYVRSCSKNTKIYLWTGFTFEELLELEATEPVIKHALNLIDVLIDGQYIKDRKDISLKMRGSTNQRIHYLKE